MNIANNCVVSIHYTLKNDAGDVLDTSDGREPLVYLQGAQNIIPGLEQALEGKTQGDELEVTVQPDDAYGQHHAELVQKVPREAFGEIDEIEPGMVFQAQTPNGQAQRIVVTAIEGEEITVDANHPLAGQQLHFSVAVEGVREGSEEEVSHGHPHD